MGRHLNLIGALLLLPLAAGCATADASRQAQDQPAAVPYSPLPPVLTPAQESEKADARRAYVACLNAAARFADHDAAAIENAAALIAPMCYPQFLRFEIASVAGMNTRDRRVYDHDGDKRQVELAGDAVRRERGVAALAAQQ